MLVVLLPGTWAGLLFARRVTEPLERLTDAVRTFGAGGDIGELTRMPDDEIGRLAEAFSDMTREITEREREKERLTERLREAQKMEAVGHAQPGDRPRLQEHPLDAHGRRAHPAEGRAGERVRPEVHRQDAGVARSRPGPCGAAGPLQPHPAAPGGPRRPGRAAVQAGADAPRGPRRGRAPQGRTARRAGAGLRGRGEPGAAAAEPGLQRPRRDAGGRRPGPAAGEPRRARLAPHRASPASR